MNLRLKRHAGIYLVGFMGSRQVHHRPRSWPSGWDGVSSISTTKSRPPKRPPSPISSRPAAKPSSAASSGRPSAQHVRRDRARTARRGGAGRRRVPGPRQPRTAGRPAASACGWIARFRRVAPARGPSAPPAAGARSATVRRALRRAPRILPARRRARARGDRRGRRCGRFHSRLTLTFNEPIAYEHATSSQTGIYHFSGRAEGGRPGWRRRAPPGEPRHLAVPEHLRHRRRQGRRFHGPGGREGRSAAASPAA